MNRYLLLVTTLAVSTTCCDSLAQQKTSSRPQDSQKPRPFASSSPGYPDWSAFTAVNWKNERPWVRYDGKWYELLEVHGVPVSRILQHARMEGWNVQKRFEEDLVQVLRLMGEKIERTTTLRLKDQDGRTVFHKNVQMTRENQATIEARSAVAEDPFYPYVPGYPNWSPFHDVRWKGEAPIVEIAGRWYSPVSVGGVTVADLLQHSERMGWDTEKRFTEDVIQMLRLKGHQIGRRTDLVLRGEHGEETTLVDFEMRPSPAIYTERPLNLDAQCRRLPSPLLSDNEWQADVDHLRKVLETQFSYLNANDFDYRSALKHLESDDIKVKSRRNLTRQIRRIMNGFIDGHAGVLSIFGWIDGLSLDMALVDSGTRVVALRKDHSQLLDPDFPYLHSIDGIPLDEWFRRVEPDVVRGSPQLVRRKSLEALFQISDYHPGVDKLKSWKFERQESSLDHSLPVVLRNADGSRTRQLPVKLVKSGPSFKVKPDSWSELRRWPESGVSEDRIGYLRLPRMDQDGKKLISRWMTKFLADTDGVIIDVRGNGGGSRSTIFALAAYLMSSDDDPRIGSVAKYRLAPEFPSRILQSRSMYPAEAKRFSNREREAISRFAEQFKPEWSPRKNRFSPWHYLVISKSADDTRPQYRGSVVILMDSDCFSATDIFLGVFKGWPSVTLIGQPSAGGSAFTSPVTLPNSQTRLFLGSMASFRKNGKLYDGHGIQPDILLEQPPEHFVHGGPDVVLKKAMTLIRRNRQ